ncbi:hypothetical protein M892_10130 [Vibrio campbellii ATCC BAA-1116]|nr:hypothetical protein M892_10130 [Vibrio campbellii ATCC BAA-1116]
MHILAFCWRYSNDKSREGKALKFQALLAGL